MLRKLYLNLHCLVVLLVLMSLAGCSSNGCLSCAKYNSNLDSWVGQTVITTITTHTGIVGLRQNTIAP